MVFVPLTKTDKNLNLRIEDGSSIYDGHGGILIKKPQQEHVN